MGDATFSNSAPSRVLRFSRAVFSPVGDVSVFNASIRYTCSGRHLYEHQDASHKSVILNASQGFGAEVNTLWVGIECAPQLTDLRDIALFFEWADYTTNNDLYTLLSVVKGYIYDNELELRPGLKYQDDQDIKNRPVFHEQNIINLLTRDIQEYYNNRFITITDAQLSDVTTQKKMYPDQFAQLFNTSE
ncbi:MAG: hypothetical protein EOO39_48270, partial [Cytophagaceae bacterium]